MGLRCAWSFNRITTTYNSYSISSQHQVVGVTIWVMSQLCWIHSLALDSYVYWMCIPTRPHECCSSQWWSGSSALSQCMWQGQRKTSSDSTQTTVPTWKLLLTNQKASQRSSIRVQSYKRLCITEIKQSVRKNLFIPVQRVLCAATHIHLTVRSDESNCSPPVSHQNGAQNTQSSISTPSFHQMTKSYK